MALQWLKVTICSRFLTWYWVYLNKAYKAEWFRARVQESQKSLLNPSAVAYYLCNPKYLYLIFWILNLLTENKIISANFIGLLWGVNENICKTKVQHLTQKNHSNIRFYYFNLHKVLEFTKTFVFLSIILSFKNMRGHYSFSVILFTYLFLNRQYETAIKLHNKKTPFIFFHIFLNI